MRILFLTNNDNTKPLVEWLRVDNEVELESSPLDWWTMSFAYDFVISYNYLFRIPKDVINKFAQRMVNLHISYLPFNGGKSPLLWGIVTGTPIGVSIHYVDEYFDTGRIIIQKEVPVDDSLNCRQMYQILQNEIQELFKYWWVNRYHSAKDTNKLISKLPKDWLDLKIKDLKAEAKKIG